MPIYDNAAKLIVANGALSLCRWLGEPTDDPQQLCSELPSETIYPDCVLELGGRVALHIEFQAHGAGDIPLRMLEYTARLRRLAKLKDYSIRHQVLVLGTGYVDDHLHDQGLRFHYHVRYLREESPNPFLADPALAPFAALANVRAHERPEVLLQAARLVLADGRPALLQATRDLALIRLKRDIIDDVWKELAVPIPTSEQYRYEEGLAEGRKLGRSDGERVGVAAAIGMLLTERFGDDDRIRLIASDLAKQPERSMKRIMEAGSIDELW